MSITIPELGWDVDLFSITGSVLNYNLINCFRNFYNITLEPTLDDQKVLIGKSSYEFQKFISFFNNDIFSNTQLCSMIYFYSTLEYKNKFFQKIHTTNYFCIDYITDDSCIDDTTLEFYFYKTSFYKLLFFTELKDYAKYKLTSNNNDMLYNLNQTTLIKNAIKYISY